MWRGRVLSAACGGELNEDSGYLNERRLGGGLERNCLNSPFSDASATMDERWVVGGEEKTTFAGGVIGRLAFPEKAGRGGGDSPCLEELVGRVCSAERFEGSGEEETESSESEGGGGVSSSESAGGGGGSSEGRGEEVDGSLFRRGAMKLPPLAMRGFFVSGSATGGEGTPILPDRVCMVVVLGNRATCGFSLSLPLAGLECTLTRGVLIIPIILAAPTKLGGSSSCSTTGTLLRRSVCGGTSGAGPRSELRRSRGRDVAGRPRCSSCARVGFLSGSLGAERSGAARKGSLGLAGTVAVGLLAARGASRVGALASNDALRDRGERSPSKGGGGGGSSSLSRETRDGDLISEVVEEEDDIVEDEAEDEAEDEEEAEGKAGVFAGASPSSSASLSLSNSRSEGAFSSDFATALGASV